MLLCWIDHGAPVLNFIYLRRIAIPLLFVHVMKTLRPLRCPTLMELGHEYEGSDQMFRIKCTLGWPWAAA